MTETNSLNINWRSRIKGYDRKPASQFTPHPDNPKIHDWEQREVIAASLNTFGVIDVVIENITNGYLVDGHERIWQALSVGDDTLVDFIQVELSEDEHLQIMEILDATVLLSKYDADKLATLRQAPLLESVPLQKLQTLIQAQSYYPTGQDAPTAPPDLSPAESLERMARVSGVVRQMVLYFGPDEFSDLVLKMAEIAKAEGLESNSEVVIFLLEHYLESH